MAMDRSPGNVHTPLKITFCSANNFASIVKRSFHHRDMEDAEKIVAWFMNIRHLARTPGWPQLI